MNDPHTRCTRCGDAIDGSAACITLHVPNNEHEEPPVLQICEGCKAAFLNWCLEGPAFAYNVAPAIEERFRKEMK